MRAIILALLLAAIPAHADQYSPTMNSSGACADGQVVGWSGGAFQCVDAGGGSGIPPGLIAAFNGACPSGWTEFASAQGRMIVGLPSGGTLAGTVGTAMTDLENRTHTHTYTQVPNHVHTLQVQGSTTASTSGTHVMTSTATGGSSRTTASPDATNNPTGGVATATTNSTSASNVLAYIQLRYCSKD